MPKVPSRTSTERRHDLADFLDSFGDTMVKKCSTCVLHRRVCKVHVRSGRCNECVRRNQRCDVGVTQSEFKRLLQQKEKLNKDIDNALEAQEKALDELRIARAREERLRQQMDLVDRRAEEAIAVESRLLEELDASEVNADELLPLDIPTEGLALPLSPNTWSALEGFPAEFWELPTGGIPIPPAEPPESSSHVLNV